MSIVLNKSDFLFKNQLSKYEGKVREVYTLKNDIMMKNKGHLNCLI